MTTPRRSYYKSYRSTFFIFPALIPLVEILPWLLGLIGGVAGVVEFLRIKVWHRPRVRVLAVLAGVCVLTGTGIAVWHNLSVPSKAEGSVEIAAAGFSKVDRYVYPVTVPARTKEFSRIWEQALPYQILGTPVISDGKMFFGTNGKTLEAHRLEDGQRLWVMTKQEPVFTSVAIDGKIGLIGEGVHTAPSATMTAFEIESGKVLWERKFRSHLEAEAIIDADKDQIWFAAGAEGVWSLGLKDGAVKWRSPIGHLDVRPLMIDGRLFAPAKLSADDNVPGSALFELNPKNGKPLWQTALPGNSMGDILESPEGGLIFTTAIGQIGLNKDTDKGWLHSVTLDGKIRWSVELPAMPLPDGSILADQKIIILALKNGALMAVNTEDGKTVWMAGTGTEFKSDALVIPATSTMPALVVAVPTGGRVTIRRALDGVELLHFKIADGSYAAPVIHDDTLYISSPYSVAAYGPVSALGIGK